METPSTLVALTRLRNLPRGPAIVLVLAGLALISGLDYATGLDYTFSLFYYIVVALGALLLGRWLGFVTSALTVILWTAVSLANGMHYGQIGGLVWAIVTRVTTLVLLVSLVTTLQDLAFELGHLAQRDPLTHVLNRRTFVEILDREVRKANRYDRPLTLAYFDIDDFKEINDRRGHQGGDGVLKALVSTIQDRIRPEDALARFGGDEFVLLLPDLSFQDAQTALGRIFGGLPAELPGGASVSVGAMTFFPVSGDLDALVHRVDQVLYEVKRSGKGRLLHRQA
jgi:diguanylate cyclase (GGDEF)-like protein